MIVENNIKELLDGRPLSWLAKRTSINRNTLASYRDGTIPMLANADVIAEAFGVTIYEVWPKLKSNKHFQSPE
jgi:lambda repressor-like predicted transcriptional regulator